MLNENITLDIGWEGSVGATTTIFLTTLVDTVWLIPFCLHASNSTIGICHGILYVVTFTSLIASISLITILMLDAATAAASTGGSNEGNSDSNTDTTIDISFYSSLIGAVLCWFLAGFFYFKAWRKRQRKQQEQLQSVESNAFDENRESLPTVTVDEHGSQLKNGNAADAAYLDLETPPLLQSSRRSTSFDIGDELSASPDDDSNVVTGVHFWTVISLTVLGSLDEISYFPSLILGKVFTLGELIIGTFFASIGVVIVIYFFLAPCKPILRCLDRIPLYGVIGAFAIILSLEVLGDLFESSISLTNNDNNKTNNSGADV